VLTRPHFLHVTCPTWVVADWVEGGRGRA